MLDGQRRFLGVPMNGPRYLSRHVSAQYWTLFAAAGYGAASAFLILVPTYTSVGANYPEWVPLIGWALGPFLAAVALTSRHPDRAWKLAVCIEVGVVAGIVFDIQVRSYLDIPSTVWPLAIVLVIIVSMPPVLVGTLVGRERAKARREGALTLLPRVGPPRQ